MLLPHFDGAQVCLKSDLHWTRITVTTNNYAYDSGNGKQEGEKEEKR